MQFVGQYWRGEKPLWKAFWLWSVLFPVLFQIAAMIAFAVFFSDSFMNAMANGDSSFPVLALLFAVVMVIYAVWVLVAVWRCAQNSKTVWKVLARIWVVLGAIGVVFNIIGIVVGSVAAIFAPSYDIPETQSNVSRETWGDVDEQTSVVRQDDVAVATETQSSPRMAGNTAVEMRVEEMIDDYYQSKLPLTNEDRAFLIENWQEAMSFATKALLSTNEGQGMGAAYIFLDIGESFIPILEEKMKDTALPAIVRVRAQWVLINMRTGNDKTAYQAYEIK